MRCVHASLGSLAAGSHLSTLRLRSDLPPRPGSVRPEADFELSWEVPEKAMPRLAAIAAALSSSSRLVLATDPDREGEAIAWHVLDALRASGALPAGLPVGRASFTDVTQKSVTAALAAPRPLADALVDAYRARRALDYLVGFTLSPLLWRKVPGAKSAGRVQSAALALVCEREAAVEAFRPTRYFTVQAMLAAEEASAKGGKGKATVAAPFAARLYALDGAPLARFALGDADVAAAAVARVGAASAAGALRVASTTERPASRAPPAPFTTSSLQQAASAQLGMSASTTMSVAQRLFEGASLGEGLITYHRTDGVNVSPDAAAELRALAAERYGAEAVPASGPRVYASKAKNAQEAHEAIRPTAPEKTPRSLADKLPRDELALYALVWRRAVASQMADALALRTRLDIEGGGVTLRANGSRITAPGWLAAQRDPEGAPPSREEAALAAAAEASAGADDAAGSADADDDAGDSASSSSGASDAPFDEATAALPALKAGAGVRAVSCDATERSTLPPARFTEGRLVKALEAAGVGRPSTYAPTLRLLLTRGYVAKPHGGGALAPTSLGRVVSSYLAAYFAAYGPPFTARMEAQLDDVAAGALPWRAALGAFWGPFTQAAAAAAAVPAPDVIDALDAALATAMFPGGEQQRVCPACGTGRLGLKLSRAGGAFVGCSGFRQGACDYGAPLEAAPRSNGDEDDPDGSAMPREAPLGAVPVPLGVDPGSGLPVTLRSGPYGLFLQLGDSPKPADAPPPSPPNAYILFQRDKRPELKAAAVAAGDDVSMGAMSRALGAAWRAADAAQRKKYEDAAAAAAADAAPAAAAWAAAHPDGAPSPPKRVSLPPAPRGAVPAVPSLDDALALLALPRVLGAHPDDGGDVTLHAGPFGLYAAHGALKASLGAAAGAGASPAEVTLEAALQRLEARRARGPGRRGRAAAAAPAEAPKQAAPKKAAGKKATKGASKAKKPSAAAAADGAAPEGKKRAPAPYFAFAAAHRAEVRASGPPGAPLSLGQAAKVLGERWRALSDAQRAEWGAKKPTQQ